MASFHARSFTRVMVFETPRLRCLDRTLKVRGIKSILETAHADKEGVQMTLSEMYEEKFNHTLEKINTRIRSLRDNGSTMLLLKENKHQFKKLPPVRVGIRRTIIPATIFVSLSNSVYMLSLLTSPAQVRNLRRQV